MAPSGNTPQRREQLQTHRALAADLAGTIKEQGAIYLPAGDSRTSFIDTEDVGEVAAAMLAESMLRDKSAFALCPNR